MPSNARFEPFPQSPIDDQVSVVLLLTGPFGVGKSSAAGHLAAQVDGTVIDPELLGADTRATCHAPDVDYQDLALWRRAVVASVGQACSRAAGEVIVVPMTLWRPEYLAEITHGLRSFGILKVVVLGGLRGGVACPH